MATRFVLHSGWAAGAGLVFALAIPLLRGATVPSGEVLIPRIGEILVPADQTIRFSGWVDFPQGAGDITISMVRGGQWQDIGTVAPAATGLGTRFNWSFTGVRRDLLRDVWPEGGTARFRIRAKRFSGGQAFLRVFDGSMVAGTNEELVLADRDPSPADLTAGSPNYLDKKMPLGPEDTRRYYQSVGSGSDGRGPSIASSVPTLAAFKRRYFDNAALCPASTPESTATYFNLGDLGLGREMHCVKNECTGETACYVKNYGNPDGTPVFNRVDKAFAAVQAKRPFATVAMVERGKMKLGAENKVFFAVYNHQQLTDPLDPDSAPLGLEAPLDSKGFNKSIPGNCLVCHGIGSRYEPSSAVTAPFNARVAGAYFLPFDLSAFEFFSTSASSPLSRGNQEAAFRGLNKIVSNTDLRFNSDVRELLSGWYGGDGWKDSTTATFHGSFVPNRVDRSVQPRR